MIEVADFFATDWETVAATLEPPVLVLGNPPWVTSATLGALDATNRPRARIEGIRGLDAVTGRSNFDVSEHVASRLLEAVDGATLAMLLKVSVARRLAERHALGGEVRRIDARRWFGAAVDAAFVVARPGPRRWAEHPDLDAEAPTRTWGFADGAIRPDLGAWTRTRHLEGVHAPPWRSGLKHDCARVMELTPDGDAYLGADGARVALEPDLVHPLLEGGDLIAGRAPHRVVIVPQRRLGASTDWIRESLPLTWTYLDAHRPALDARRSRIYQGRPPFSIFGVGDYAFAPWKVAVAGLSPALAFRLVGPVRGKPTMLDDTAYFLPFDTEAEARDAHVALSSDEARAFYEARMFADAKRPVTKRLLMSLDRSRL
ncbi:MAG: hypothetical protein R3B82_08330 [Sandaracinaceae bacterium]